MGHGLGKNQQMILDVLNKQDAPVSVLEVAREKTGTDDPSRSARVAMRRSAKALANRGKIQCQRVPPQKRSEKASLLYCWLPSHMPPWTTPTVIGDPEAAVRSAVERFQDLPEAEWCEEWSLCSSKIPDGADVWADMVPYSYVMRRAVKALGGHMIENPHATAVWRATRSLESDGNLMIYRNANGTAWAVSVAV